MPVGPKVGFGGFNRRFSSGIKLVLPLARNYRMPKNGSSNADGNVRRGRDLEARADRPGCTVSAYIAPLPFGLCQWRLRRRDAERATELARAASRLPASRPRSDSRP